MIQPETLRANNVLRDTPLKRNPTDRERSVCGTQNANILYTAGNIVPSPSPIPIRAASSTGMEIVAARGVKSVNTDQHTTAKASTRLPPNRLATTPPGT